MEKADNPGLMISPPLLYAIAFLVVLVLSWLWPWRVGSQTLARWAGIVTLSMGLALGLWAQRALRQAGTNINPTLPTTALVTAGAYGRSRNPLYLALSLAFLGLSLAVNSLWGLVALVVLLVVIHYGIVLREERYLADKFGESYRQYCSRVRRYL
jgi:protein-S-isoprenylcysteine O-methyltransferase Ste14